MTTLRPAGEQSSSPPRSFLPLIAVSGFTMTLTAPLEVLYAQSIGYGPVLLGAFVLAASFGVIVVDVLGTRLVPALDAQLCLAVSMAGFGLACAGLAVAPSAAVMLPARLLQGLVSGFLLGGALQAAVRVHRDDVDPARALSRFNAAFLFGGAVGSPFGLVITGLIDSDSGYRWVFAGTGVLALMVAALTGVALPPLPAPSWLGRGRVGLPQLQAGPGDTSALLLAMVGDFIRGGVLFTALPLTGAVRDFPTLTIGVAIASMSAVEIGLLILMPRLLAHLGLTAVLCTSLMLGCGCAVVLALSGTAGPYLAAAGLFGVTLAGLTAGLPMVLVTMTGESSAGLARFRISAGIGMLVGTVGCATLLTGLGAAPSWWLVCAVIAISLLPLRGLAPRLAPAKSS